jgi:hypothetical protein
MSAFIFLAPGRGFEYSAPGKHFGQSQNAEAAKQGKLRQPPAVFA